MQLVSTWAVLVALTGVGPMALGQDARRDFRRLPPDFEAQLERETLLKVMETVPWAATEVEAAKRTLSAVGLSPNQGVPVEDPQDSALSNLKPDRLRFHSSFSRFPVTVDAKILIDGPPGS